MFKSVLVIIKNSKGEFFLHRRRKNKLLAPDSYALGAAGKSKIGESAAAAATRELFEETGIRANPHFLFQIPGRHLPIIYKVYVFEILWDKEISPSLKEWSWSAWVNKNDIKIYLSGKNTKRNNLKDKQKIYIDMLNAWDRYQKAL